MLLQVSFRVKWSRRMKPPGMAHAQRAVATVLLLVTIAVLTKAEIRTPFTVKVPPKSGKGGNIYPMPSIPYQVVVVTAASDGSTKACGGAVIEGRHVLTAASCVLTASGERAPSVRVALAPARGAATLNAIVYHVVRETFFKRPPKPRVEGDVVLLQVDREIQIKGKVIEHLHLNTDKGFRSKNCYLIAWNGIKPQLLGRSLQVPPVAPVQPLQVVGIRRCVGNGYSHRPPKDLLCLGATRDTCQEPAGAPVVCGGQLVALTSGAHGCGVMRFGMYADAAFYAAWVATAVAAGAARAAAREELSDGEEWERLREPGGPPRRR